MHSTIIQQAVCIIVRTILVAHIVESLYSLGSMFVGRQNFPGSRERNFVGKCNRDNLKKYKKKMIVYTFMWM